MSQNIEQNQEVNPSACGKCATLFSDIESNPQSTQQLLWSQMSVTSRARIIRMTDYYGQHEALSVVEWSALPQQVRRNIGEVSQIMSGFVALFDRVFKPAVKWG